MANATPDTKVATLEINEKFAWVTSANWEMAGVEDKVELLLGDTLETLPKLPDKVSSRARGKWDMVFIDADKSHGPGACIIVDSVVMKGSLVDEEQIAHIPAVKWSRALVDKLGKDGRVEAVAVQTVREKTSDGFVFAVVK